MVTCKGCGKEFEQSESMEQHYSAVHAKEQPSTPQPSYKKSKKKPIFMISGIVIVLIIGYFVFFNNSPEEKPLIDDGISINLDEVPKGFTHRHPVLSIVINGRQTTIPANLGAGVGYAGPVHTHDTTGKLHYETANPSAENSVLGFFFEKIWRKTFNSNCIFEYCNGPEGNLTMTVNGEPNFKFDKYMPKDRDNIVIKFE